MVKVVIFRGASEASGLAALAQKSSVKQHGASGASALAQKSSVKQHGASVASGPSASATKAVVTNMARAKRAPWPQKQ